MKLNATAEMMPITWARFNRIHPFAPLDQAQGYQVVVKQLEAMLAEITGFPAVSLQPNSGAQGELAGLLVIRKHHETRGEGQRDVCLIPASAHGTNPASAAMAGMRVVVVACDEKGYVELGDLEAKAKEHAKDLAALMVTYPSTYGDLRGGDRAHLRDRPRARRAGVPRRREPQRAGGPLPPGRRRRRRLPREPAQDVLHPARRRRPGHGAHRRRGAPGEVPAAPPGRARSAASRASARSARRRGAARASCSSRGRTSR